MSILELLLMSLPITQFNSGGGGGTYTPLISKWYGLSLHPQQGA